MRSYTRVAGATDREMVRDYEWTNNADDCLRRWGLKPFDVEEAVRLGHGSRRRNRPGSSNPGREADWITRWPHPGGHGTIVVAYDWPARDGQDEARARLVSCWVVR